MAFDGATALSGDIPPWLYMRVFFAVGLPKGACLEHSCFQVIPPYQTRYSMRSLKAAAMCSNLRDDQNASND